MVTLAIVGEITYILKDKYWYYKHSNLQRKISDYFKFGKGLLYTFEHSDIKTSNICRKRTTSGHAKH